MLKPRWFIAPTLIVMSSVPAQTQVPAATCVLHRDSADRFVGVCDWPAVNVPVSLTSRESADEWVGTMRPGFPEDPDAFEAHAGREGVAGTAKTPYGWFALDEVVLSADTLTITFLPGQEAAATPEDVRILRRAAQILRDTSVWNQRDDRTCEQGAARWSLYCAVSQAIYETIGRFHYRQPALQAVRQVVGDIGRNRIRTHRLMDYNNHPDTTLQDIHTVLRTAADRIERENARPR